MYNSPEYQAMINVARTYAEGFKKPDVHKMQDQAAMKPDTAKGEQQARKIDRVRKVFSDDDMGAIAKDAVKGVEKENRLTGQKKALGRAYDNSGEKQSKEVTELQKRAAEQSLKAKPKRPKSRLKSPKRPSTIKKK